MVYLTEPSQEEEMMYSELGLKATLRTGAVCPSKMVSLKVSRFMTLMVMSSEPAQIRSDFSFTSTQLTSVGYD